MNIMCVYEIKNIVNNHRYVGSTIKFDRRKRTHLRDLKNQKHHNRHLQNAYNFYGEDKFKFSILEEFYDVNDAIPKEIEWANKLKPEYNVMKDIKSHIGIKRSLETRRKISNALIGRRHTEQTKEKLRKINTGKKYSNITKKKKSKSLRKMWAKKDKKERKQISNKVKNSRLKNGGFIVTKEQKEKISKSLKTLNLQTATSIKIQKFDLNDVFICEYPSFTKAEKHNNLWRGSISYNICTLGKNVYKKYKWKIIK